MGSKRLLIIAAAAVLAVCWDSLGALRSSELSGGRGLRVTTRDGYIAPADKSTPCWLGTVSSGCALGLHSQPLSVR